MNESELSNEAIAKISDMLMAYHRRSFRIRCAGVFNGYVDPPIVDELDNLRHRLRADYSNEEKMAQAISLHEIISRNRWEIRALAQSAKEVSHAGVIADRIATLMEELEAANWMLEKLDG